MRFDKPQAPGSGERINPNKRVYQTPEGRLTHTPRGVTGEARVENRAVSAETLLHARSREMLKEADAIRSSLQKSPQQEAIAMRQTVGEKPADVQARIIQLRADRLARMQQIEDDALSLDRGLNDLAAGKRPDDAFMRQLDVAENLAAKDLDSRWNYRDIDKQAYADSQARLRAITDMKARASQLPEQPS